MRTAFFFVRVLRARIETMKNQKLLRKKLVIGNWKMNPETLDEAKKIFLGIGKAVAPIKKVLIVVCPPNLYVAELKKFKGGPVLGVQDIFFEMNGSYTGFTSPLMAKNSGAEFAIIGHSERRQQGESDEAVNRKVLAAIKSNLFVVLCIGEETRSGDGQYLEVIKKQIESALQNVSKKMLKNVVIAYEPVWTIGAKEPMEPRDLHEMKLYIRKILIGIFGVDAGAVVPILYGGSVLPENALAITAEGEVDGLLVGRESLNPENFAAIVSAVSSIK